MTEEDDTRTPEEALAAIRKLCDSTIWILSAKDVRPILDSVRPRMGDLVWPNLRVTRQTEE